MQHDWISAIEQTVFIPNAYRAPSVDRIVARQMLRCSDHDLDVLTDLGLPVSTDDGEGQCFDANDLYNVGMYSGRGNTQPELAFKMLFKFTTGDPKDLFRPRRWKFVLKLDCPDCAGVAPWELYEPTPETFGGSRDPMSDRIGESQAEAEYGAVITTVGAYTPLQSQQLRDICKDYLDANYRWHMLPATMQFDFQRVHSLGVTNCISASLKIAEEFRASGYHAEARRGWFCGVLGGAIDFQHAWVEVVDDDDCLRVVDLATAVLARRLSAATTKFQELCLGSPINKVVASCCPANARLAIHGCGADKEVRMRSVIRPVAGTQR